MVIYNGNIRIPFIIKLKLGRYELSSEMCYLLATEEAIEALLNYFNCNLHP